MSDPEKHHMMAPSQPKESGGEIQGLTPFENPDFDCVERCCLCASGCMLCILCPILLPASLNVLTDFERGVKLRLGRRCHDNTISGGLHILLPCADELLKIDMRESTVDIPQQNIITAEGLSVRIDACVYYRVFDAGRAILGIRNVRQSVTMLAQTKLREVLGQHTFEEIQLQREALATTLKRDLDDATDPWGLDVTRVEITDMQLPAAMQRAMGTEAEAQREAKAKLIQAEGEKKAATMLKEAADIMAEAPGTMQLRFLQTLTTISAEKNSTMVVPFPSDLLNAFGGAGRLPGMLEHQKS